VGISVYRASNAVKVRTLIPQQGSGAPVIIVDGNVYVLMNDHRILAIDAGTGKLIWNNTYGTTFDAVGEAAKYPFLQPPLLHGHALNYYRDKGWLIGSSLGSCNLYAVDAKTGITSWVLRTEQICGTVAELGDPTKLVGKIPDFPGAGAQQPSGFPEPGSLGNQGFYSSLGTHPPVFLGNIMFFPVAGASGQGGRSFVTAFDMTDPQNPKRLYRTFTQGPAQGDPNWAINQCKAVGGNGWYFEYPKFLESINYPARDRDPTYLATKCTDVADDVVKNDGIDMVPGSPTFGRMHTSSQAGSAVWGNYPLDQETGIVALGWGDQGPYTNLTNKHGPGLHGSGYTAHDVRTGKMVWWFQAVLRDLWDYDCSWGGIIGQVQGKKAYIKGCKDGIVHALDWSTGKPFWNYDAPSILRGGNNIKTYYGVGANNRPTDPEACCKLTKADMGKPWMTYPLKDPFVQNCYTVCLESDFAYDGKRIYVATFNNMGTHRVTNVITFGNSGAAVPRANFPDQTFTVDSNIDAVDVNTGKRVWSYKIDTFGFRGGVMTTGGMVVVYAADGNLKFLDAESGKLLHEKTFGVPVSVMPTIGADKNGKYKIFAHVGGSGGFLFSQAATTAGNLMAFGLPDKIPQPQVITKEVIKEVPKEVIKEVIKEVVKEVPKEVIKEVVKEVPKEVTVETISPISYAAIGIGVVMIVISGVLFSRRKKA